ncbi:metal ABC transporter solute-binding protein, Zn/Mn family [Aminithiophilus ramosus]|uniref:metal ABC transporter solute-binding protein, Zn/Mn family n=1 Tax=Aminithiophilus ramosus TaxID=3029084 RepID=UPI002367AB66|nr:zinc ABC transporter substrate-binding protein [Aminithiophilus ramosus]
MKRPVLSGILTVIALLAVVLPASADPLSVFVSVLPQKFFVEAIGGPSLTVHVMVPPGASPATYEPKPQQMVELSGAALYFSIGVPFEKAWMKRLSSANASLKIVATDEGTEKRAMAAHHHDGDDGHDHHHGHGLDPHIWLSPRSVLTQGRVILRALVAADPERASLYRENYRRFAASVVALDLELMERLSVLPEGTPFMVFHPSWGYFADDYGLEQLPIEVEGKEPKAGELTALVERAKAEKIGVIFVQPQFSRKAAEALARSAGAAVEILDPLAEDWDENLRRVAEALVVSASRRQ